jgi:hypothetical protein
MKNRIIRYTVVRLAFGALLHGTAYAAPSTQLYQPVASLAASDVQRPAQPNPRLVFTTPSGSARRLGMPRLFDFGEGAVSIDK